MTHFSRIVATAATLLLLLVGTGVAQAETPQRKPNIIFILADDKYDRPMRNVVFYRENTDFAKKIHSLQISADCGHFRAIAGN